MNRVEFTHKINNLIAGMILEGENPIIDFVKRSDEEQHRLWKIGRDDKGNRIGMTVTNCDGYTVRSAHQSGKAMDIYFLGDDFCDMIEPKKGWHYWHDLWESKGGKPVIAWDLGHFEA